MGKAFLPFFLVLFLGFGYAQSCDIVAEDTSEFLLELYLQEDGTGLMTTVWHIPYEWQCLQQAGLENLAITPMECREEGISDALFRSLDFFVISSDCLFSYDSEKGEIVIAAESVTEKIAEKKEDFWEIRFEKWNLPEAGPETGNVLRIGLPKGSKVVSYFPKNRSLQEGVLIEWDPIPNEPVSIQYNVPVPFEKNPAAWAGLGFVLIAVAAYVLIKVASEKKIREKIEGLRAKKNALAKELKNLETAYLRRRISGDEFEERVDEIKEEISETNVEEQIILEKEKQGKKK